MILTVLLFVGCSTVKLDNNLRVEMNKSIEDGFGRDSTYKIK